VEFESIGLLFVRSWGALLLYRPLTSNGTIIARVLAQAVNAQAGVMIRSTFDPDSTNVFPHFYYDEPGSDVSLMDYRTIIGQGGGVAGGGNVGSSYWMKAVRNANTCLESEECGRLKVWTPC
jgi:hypothetical protein